MNLTATEVDRHADRLDSAHVNAKEIESLSDTVDWDIESAYAVQQAVVARRMARGERPVGLKLGFTSKAKMAQMGVSDVIVGRLTDAMRIADGSDIDLGRFIHAKVEPEVAFRFGVDVDLDDPQVSVEACVDAVAPALEVIDSRYRDFRFTYGDVVADNTSAAAFAVGPWLPPTDLANRAVSLTIGGATVATGSTAAILGDPIRALHGLARMCSRYGIEIQRGAVFLAGAATAAVPLTAGAVTCEVAGLGRVTIRAVSGSGGRVHV